MDDMARRAFIKGASIGALAFSVGGVEVLLTPRQARAQGAAFKVLTPAEVETLEAVGDTLAIGAREAGIAHFVDQQLTQPAPLALLSMRVSEARPPYVNFYRSALGAIARAAQAAEGRPLGDLDEAARIRFVAAMSRRELKSWDGPPQGTRLCESPQRCRRRRLWHRRRLRPGGRAVPAPYPSRAEVVRWRSKKSMP